MAMNSLLAVNDAEIMKLLLVGFVIILLLLILFSLWFYPRQWRDSAKRFGFRFGLPHEQNEYLIEGEQDGSQFRIDTYHESGGEGGGITYTRYAIQPSNIQDVLYRGRRDLDHYAVSKVLNAENVKAILSEDKKTRACLLRYKDGWIVWQTYDVIRKEEILTSRMEQMLRITTEFVADQEQAGN